MIHWMCTSCGYYLQASRPPDRCPSCNETCVFNNVTCYRPECGSERNMDPLLVSATLKALTGTFKEAVGRPVPSITGAPKGAVARPVPSIIEGLPVVEFFGNLTEEQKQRVTRLGRTEIYEPNAIICTQGDAARKLYLVDEGQVVVESETPRGIRIPIIAVSTGEVFGWSALVPPYRFTATVRALSRTRILAIEREALLTFMQAAPALGLTIMQNISGIMATRLRNLEIELIDLVQGRR